MKHLSKYMFEDPKDGQVYACCLVGKTIWFAKSYALDIGKDFKNGRYPWEQAQHLCPEGWRLPTRQDFEHLFDVAAKLAGLPAWSSNEAALDWFSFCFDLNECLVENAELGFFIDVADYNDGFPNHERGYWLDSGSTYFSSSAGQNEHHLEFKAATRKAFHHVRYVHQLV